MKKLLMLLAAAMLVLTACGDTEEEGKEVSKVETEGQESDSGKDESETKEESQEYNEVLLDSDNAKVELVSITHVKDTMFDEEYHSIKLAIENKLDKTIVIQSDEVSIDGLMATDDVIFSEEVSGGKKSNGELRIQTFDEDLPPLDEELEFILLVIDEETYEPIEKQDVKVEIK